MFDYGGAGIPTSVEARAYPLEQEMKWLPGAEGARLMRPEGGHSVLVTEDLRGYLVMHWLSYRKESESR